MKRIRGDASAWPGQDEDDCLGQLNKWMSTHQRLVITTLAVIVGVYLILVGVSKL